MRDHGNDADAYETGGMMQPSEVANARLEKEKLISRARRVEYPREFQWPPAGKVAVPEYETRGFFCLAPPWLSPGGVGRFFDDRPFAEGLAFGDWLERLVYYYDGPFAADTAFAFVALNMLHRRRAAEQSDWFLQSHVEHPPERAADVQDQIRAGDDSLLNRLRHFGGTDAYWAQRADDVDSWLNYHVDRGDGVPTLFVTGSCAEFHWPESLDLLEDHTLRSSKKGAMAVGQPKRAHFDNTLRYIER